MRFKTRFGVWLTMLVGSILTVVACGGTGEPTSAPTSPEPEPATTVLSSPSSTAASATTNGESSLPTHPDSDRVDLVEPTFSNPTNVTNSLNPISELHSVVMLGESDGEPFRTEVTLLPETVAIEWNGQQIEALESQYVAFVDGRIQEVALDWYAQADDGSVWYLGEDVFNYEEGVVADTEGTWKAGVDGPGAMIMPADPHVGDVYRPENAFPIVFEEVTVKEVGLTIEGPSGPVSGAIVVEELHMEGTYEDKTFAPGYGEFSTGSGANLEAVALAVPVDQLNGDVPAELAALTSAALEMVGASESMDWNETSATLESMTTAWETYRATGLPPMLETQTSDVLDALSEFIAAEDTNGTRQAAIDLARASLDFELRYRPPTEVDRDRFELWLHQLLLDAEPDDQASVKGDVTTMQWVWDRFRHSMPDTDASSIESFVAELRADADAGDLAAVTEAATELLALMAD